MSTDNTAITPKVKRLPSVKRQETKARKEAARGFPLPLSLTCTKSGKVNTYTSLTYIRKLIEKAGSLEQLRQGYVCAEERRKNVDANG